jgi:hypothetical protein
VLGRSSIALVLAGVLLLNLSMVALWSWRTFASSQGFADVTTDMLKEPAVREAIAEQIADELEGQTTTAQLAVAARPVVEAVVADLAATDAFQGVFHGAVRELHTAIVEGRRSRLLVHVDDAAQIVKQGLAEVNPELAASIPDGALDIAVGVTQSTPIDTTMRLASLAGWLALPLAIGAMACFVVGVRLALDRRRAIEAVGLTLILTGVIHFALLAVGVNLAASVGSDDRQRTAMRAVFWSLTHLLNVQAKVVVTIGTVLVIAAAHAGSGQVRSRLGTVVDEVGRRLGEPTWRALACLTAIAVGYFAMRWPEATTAIVFRLTAFVGFVVGAIGLLDVLGSVNWAFDGSERVRRAAGRLAIGTTATISVVSVTLLFGGMAFVRALRAPDVEAPDLETSGCNGSMVLCDRRLDQVVFAGTHNSMAASAEEGWLVARHTGGLGAQLAAGVRAFLIDLHYGGWSGDRVRTDLRAESDVEGIERLDPEERAGTERLLGFASVPDGDRDVFLCHIYCETGATSAADAFRGVHDFLRENPNEVIVLVLEDHVAAADAMEALQRGGLADRALQWPRGGPLPTLRQLIEDQHNVVVLVENEGGAAPWYVPAFDVMSDTPYRFDQVGEFSCAVGRGAPDNSLLLVNHWLTVDPPNPAVAAKVNAGDVLRERAAACREERGRLPNIIAVDFYASGDLFEVVDELNGVASAADAD